MGDRAFVSVEVLEKDAARFREILGGADEVREPDQGFVLFEIFEADRGAEDEIREAADSGLTFHGFREGDNYSMEFASLAGEFLEIASVPDTGPVVRVDDDGNPLASDVQHARAYCSLLKRIKALRSPSNE